MRKLALLLLALSSLLYPLAIHLGLGQRCPAILAAILAASWLLRLQGLSRRRSSTGLAAVAVLAYCCLLAWHPWPRIDRWYPVIINLGLAIGFALSLRRGPSAIEQLARLSEPELPPEGVAYTRKVTWVWLGFFIINGSIAAALSCWASLRWWTLYNGGLAYLLMGMLFTAEYCLRRHVRRQQQPG